MLLILPHFLSFDVCLISQAGLLMKSGKMTAKSLTLFKCFNVLVQFSKVYVCTPLDDADPLVEDDPPTTKGGESMCSTFTVFSRASCRLARRLRNRPHRPRRPPPTGRRKYAIMVRLRVGVQGGFDAESSFTFAPGNLRT